jgi:hypothetical protein
MSGLPLWTISSFPARAPIDWKQVQEQEQAKGKVSGLELEPSLRNCFIFVVKGLSIKVLLI